MVFVASLLLGCTSLDPGAPLHPSSVFPYGVAPDLDRPDHVDARVETETWTPGVGADMTALYVRKALEHNPGAPDAVLERSESHHHTLPPLDLAPPMHLDFAGDLLPVGGGGTDRSALAIHTADLFAGDLSLANLESPTAPGFGHPRPVRPQRPGLPPLPHR